MYARTMLALVCGLPLLLAACGDGYDAGKRTPTASPSSSCAAGARCASTTASAGTSGTVVSTVIVVPGATDIPADIVPAATPTPIEPSALPTVAATADTSGATGIAGTVTLGPTCPVQRIDSPCPDRPYEARLTLWRNGDKIAETRSGADGRFRFDVPAGTYLLIGESVSTLPRGSEQEVRVVDGQVTTVRVSYDSGIR